MNARPGGSACSRYSNERETTMNLALALSRFVDIVRTVRIQTYRPNPKQLEFHAMGATKLQRAFFAANRCGKTTSAAAEVVYHATGEYPAWWRGRRFRLPCRIMIIGIDHKQLRESTQRIIMGDSQPWGSGMLPAAKIKKVDVVHGVAGAVDKVYVEHVSGGTSILRFCTSKMNWDSLQGDQIKVALIDEDLPPGEGKKVFGEVVPRTWITDEGSGIIIFATTPTRGLTELVSIFWKGVDYIYPPDSSRGLVRMEIDEATHLTKEQIAMIRREVQEREPWMADARLRGIPVIGSGVVYPFTRKEIACEPLRFTPNNLYELEFLCGMDSGFANSSTSLVWLARDREANQAWLWDSCTIRRGLPDDIAPHIKNRDHLVGFPVPVVWYKDMSNQERSTACVAVEEFVERNVNMAPEWIRFGDDRRDNIEAGIQLVYEMLYFGHLKICDTPANQQWFAEQEQYARDEEGKLNKKGANQFDVMDSTRYGTVGLYEGYAEKRPQEEYGWHGYEPGGGALGFSLRG